ncbi:hypothetical protein FRC03_010705 [Tulasnella sp. 419]|nr:hypothetical protein FRC03_010705 [Tulasnella sp. 419]
MTTPASENLKKQDARPVDAQHSKFYPIPLSVGQASLPNFGNKINANLIGLESTDLIRTMLLPTFGIKAKYPYNTECNAQIIRTLKQLLNEAGVYTTQFKWSILALILYKHRLRWVGWPVEINHSPQMKKRPPGIPGSMRAHELDVMKAALARRLFSKNGDGLSLVEWNDDENEEDFPPLFITTDGGRHSLRETVIELLESGRTAIFRARDSRESSAQKGSEKSESE